MSKKGRSTGYSRPAPHLLLGVDSEINNRGPISMMNKHYKGLEKDQCSILMESLGWTYEFVEYHNNIGYVKENGSTVDAPGLLGDVYHGRIDMACGRFRMTQDRLKFFTFSYPIDFSVKQVYLIRDPGKRHDMNFILMPFSSYLWVLLSATIIVVTLTLLLIRYVEFFDYGESLTKTSSNALYHMISFSTNFVIEARPLPTFATFWGTTSVWMLIWTHVFIVYYTSELRGMLIVSSTKKVPFSDFNGFVKALEEGSYRFLTPSHDWIPECPGAYTAVSCVELFDRIFKKYPPVKGGISQLANESFVRKQKSPLVSVQWYEESRIGGKYSVWTQKTFRSNIWVIADFTVSPASFILATNFSYLNELNKGIIELLPAFKMNINLLRKMHKLLNSRLTTMYSQKRLLLLLPLAMSEPHNFLVWIELLV